ncbi:MAG: transcription antitermination factor NusB [Sphaerochaetaceae bacterium]|nr:transcription antitermination factor NusB [Sphaerochaetaceae bacterium]
MRSRHLARSIALQTLYSLDINKRILDVTLPFGESFQGLSKEEEDALETDVVLYALYLINGVLEHLEEIDEFINRFSTRRSIDRISFVDRNILRISVFSLLYCKDIDSKIIIDEAVKLSQEFSTEVNYRFINGLLDTAVRHIHDNSENGTAN